MELRRLEPAQAPRALDGVLGQILQDFGVLESPAHGQLMLGCVPCSVPPRQASSVAPRAEKPRAGLERRVGFWQGDGFTQAGKEPALSRERERRFNPSGHLHSPSLCPSHRAGWGPEVIPTCPSSLQRNRWLSMP